MLLTIPAEHARLRIDEAIRLAMPDVPLTAIRRAVDAGDLVINGQKRTSGWKVKAGDRVTGDIPDLEWLTLARGSATLDVIFEDDHLLAVNKPPDMLSHPTPKERGETLLNALLAYPAFTTPTANVRPMLMHRLDRDTSGVIVIAKTEAAAKRLYPLFEERRMEKRYLAIVVGGPEADTGEISAPIGRNYATWPRWRVMDDGKPALSSFRVERRYDGFSLLDLAPKTGRTHQLRIHTAFIGCPILGDRVYGNQPNKEFSLNRPDIVAKRQMLHAAELTFNHPWTKKDLELRAPLPEDMKIVLAESP